MFVHYPMLLDCCPLTLCFTFLLFMPNYLSPAISDLSLLILPSLPLASNTDPFPPGYIIFTSIGDKRVLLFIRSFIFH